MAAKTRAIQGEIFQPTDLIQRRGHGKSRGEGKKSVPHSSASTSDLLNREVTDDFLSIRNTFGQTTSHAQHALEFLSDLPRGNESQGRGDGRNSSQECLDKLLVTGETSGF